MCLTVGTAAANRTAAVSESEAASAPAAATTPEADPAGEPHLRRGAGARRSADVTSPPPAPPGGREGATEPAVRRSSLPQLPNSAAGCPDMS